MVVIGVPAVPYLPFAINVHVINGMWTFVARFRGDGDDHSHFCHPWEGTYSPVTGRDEMKFIISLLLEYLTLSTPGFDYCTVQYCSLHPKKDGKANFSFRRVKSGTENSTQVVEGLSNKTPRGNRG